LPPIAGTMLIAAAVLAMATAWSSTMPGQVTTTQEISVVALAAVTGAATSAFNAAGGASLLATILVTIGLTTALCGVGMLALGMFRLGRITRFVPYPIFAGFLAITGWYLITGGLETIIGGHLGFDRLPEFLEPGIALKVGLVLGFVVVVEVLQRRFPSGAALPLTVLIALVAFNGVVLATGMPREALQAAGWLINVPATGMTWPPIGWADLLAVDWAAVANGLVFAPFVVVITAAGGMMNVSGIELDTGRDLDLNVELRSMGIGNVAAGLVGGIPGFPAVSATMLSLRSGTPYRAIGIVAGLVALAALVFAPLVLGIVPLPVLGALLIWVGVSLTLDWLVRPIRTLRRSEYAIILIMLGVSIAAGLPAGIGTGLIAALLLFVVEYARVDGIRYVASGRDFHSRSISHERRSLMADRGEVVAIIKLSGFIFFGTSDSIVQRIVAQAASKERGQWYAVLDFSRVTGLDSSTALSFQRLRRMAERDGFHVVFAGLGALASRLADSGLDLAQTPFRSEASLEAALRWVEDQVLGAETGATHHEVSAEASLVRLLGDEALAQAVSPYLKRVEFGAGERLIQQGAKADDIYFIETGRGSVVLESGHGVISLMDFRPGTVLGEVAFYGTDARSASALAETPGAAWKLSRAEISRIEAEKPLAAAAFHRALARLLAERLQSANRLIRVLAD
jgi:SulP family sulfate permease